MARDRPRTPREPLLVDDIRLLVSTARERCKGWADEVLERRDSAILLLGFAGAYRRSELSKMVCEDLTVHRHDGLHIRLRKSKTDQEGRGAMRALPYTKSHETCPPCAHVRWIQVVAAFDNGGRPFVIRPRESGNRSMGTCAVGEYPEPPPAHLYFAQLPGMETWAQRRYPGQQSTRPSAAAPNMSASTPPRSPSSAGTHRAPGSSPEAPATAPTAPPSQVRPARPYTSTPSRCTAANTRHRSAALSPTSGFRSY